MSEKVKLSCSVSGSSDWTFTWLKDGTLLQENTDFSFPGTGAELAITANRIDLAGQYTCTGKNQGHGRPTKPSQPVQVNVIEPPTPTLSWQSRWPKVFKEETVSFKCELPTSDWKFAWYKDKNPLNKEGSTLNISPVKDSDEGEYSCQAQHTSRPVNSRFSNTENLDVFPNNPKPSLTKSPGFNKFYPKESINFTCNVDMSSEWTYEWYQNGSKIPESSSGNYYKASVDHSSSGEYQCKVKRGERPKYTSDSVSVQVAEPPTPTLKLESRWLEVFTTEVLNFTCEVASTDWTFIWYRDEKALGTEGPSLVIPSVTADDRGKYTCKAQLKNRGVISKPSDPIAITVHENKPTPMLTRSLDFPTMYPGESISFTCTVDVSTGWEYEWHHNGKRVSSITINTYRIDSVTHASSGEYRCLAKRRTLRTDESVTASLKVSDPPTPILKLLSPWLDVFEKETLNFSCEVSSSEWTFTWQRDGTELQDNSRLIQNEKGSILNIPAVRLNDKGLYTCKAHLKHRSVSSDFSNSANVLVYESLPIPRVRQDPVFDPMYPGETVKLLCEVDVSSGWSYDWYKDGTNLHKTDKNITIILKLSDKGRYSCTARRGEKTLTGHSQDVTLNVQETPVPLLKQKTQWLDVFPSEAVELSCMMEESSGWNFTWYQNTKGVPKDNVIISDMGDTLSITHASTVHRGSYCCSGTLDDRRVSSNRSSEVTLDVYESKPTVTLLQSPSDSLMHTGDEISFACHINVSSGWKYQWYKDNDSPLSSGIVHNISSAKTSDSGSYRCKVSRGEEPKIFETESQAVQLKIAERPKANIILLTGWSEVFSTDSLVLNCEVMDNSDNSWNYTWFKEGKELPLPPSQKHKVTPQDDPEQSFYTCRGIRDGRPHYSKDSDSYRTKNLLLKRRILLSISGCLFFGIIAVFIGCIALRIFRKPVAADEKQVEDNLFLTMAQLKDRNDAPCPLVEYITDTDLNPPSKEGEENPTSCSETTPLPITSPEEQAVTTNGKETTENGSSMVSFLH
ncbi:basement membrane-specific heparan sulfate proteoglycan core protein isoform 1-T1 [Fundulus diaphanus]